MLQQVTTYSFSPKKSKSLKSRLGEVGRPFFWSRLSYEYKNEAKDHVNEDWKSTKLKMVSLEEKGSNGINI